MNGTTADSIVRAVGVRRIYNGTVQALRAVDLEVSRGDMIAIVGPSGSGKTTLLNCLSGLDRIDEGQVFIDGHDIAALSDDDRSDHRARHMGFVFQAFNLLPVLTSVENVEFPLLLLGERPRAARERAVEMLEAVGLAGREGHRPSELSGGEQQRVAVARALIHRPAVIWADEPTGNLDTESSAAVMDLLLHLNVRGHTIVFVTHDLLLASRAPRIVRMSDGQIESGTTRDVDHATIPEAERLADDEGDGVAAATEPSARP